MVLHCSKKFPGKGISPQSLVQAKQEKYLLINGDAEYFLSQKDIIFATFPSFT